MHQITKNIFVLIGSSSWDILATSNSDMVEGLDYPGTIISEVGGVIFNIAKHIALRLADRKEILLFSSIGSDNEAKQIMKKIKQININSKYLIFLDCPSDKFVVIERKDGTIFSAVSDFTCTKRGENQLIRNIVSNDILPKKDFEKTIVLDGNLSKGAILELLKDPNLSRASFNLISVSSVKSEKLKSILSFLSQNKTNFCLYVNFKEAKSFAGKSFKSVKEAAVFFLNLGISEIIITDGSEVCCSAKILRGTPTYCEHIPNHLNISSTLGAGDVFAAEHIYIKTKNQELTELEKLAKATEAANNFLIAKNKFLTSKNNE